MLIGLCGNINPASATHISQPIAINPKTQYTIGETVVMQGWVNYNDQATPDVLLHFKVTRPDGSIASDQSYPSDQQGRFEFRFDTQNEKPGAYQIIITSHCLEIHRYACTYKNQTIPIRLNP